MTSRVGSAWALAALRQASEIQTVIEPRVRLSSGSGERIATILGPLP